MPGFYGSGTYGSGTYGTLVPGVQPSGRAYILSLVQALALEQADATMIEHYYDEVISELGDREVLTTIELINVAANSSVYSIPDTTIDLIGVFFGDSFLNETSIQEIEAFAGKGWRGRRGSPIAYTIEQESKSDFRLFPNPSTPSGDFEFAFGSPLGHDYPQGAIAAVCTEWREDVPGWLELPLTFEILSREFARESDHQDKAFSEVCRIASAIFLSMVM